MIANTHTHTPLKEYKFQYYYDGTMSSGLINKSGKTLYYVSLAGTTDYIKYNVPNGSMFRNISNASLFSIYDSVGGNNQYIMTRSIIDTSGNYGWFGLNEDGQYVPLNISTTTTNDFSVYYKE